ncbi:MAG: serine dehydratase subunit alpha family protein, partial [Erysipelotrichaceae bacterium]|nr:serine dehydratase subunit alpha family protein [Erysipelotrichaceae bacterium]
MENYQTYVQILKEELVPAMGCTEPIALAYCAAVARKTLNQIPEKVIVEVSGNILKNVKSVVVPNTNGHKGIQSAVAAGIVYGKPELVLEVISQVSEEEKRQLDAFLQHTVFEIHSIKSEEALDIRITVIAKEESAKVRIARSHSHIASIERNGEVIYQSDFQKEKKAELADRKALSIEKIVQFANEVDLKDVQEVLQRQVDYNYAIA